MKEKTQAYLLIQTGKHDGVKLFNIDFLPSIAHSDSSSHGALVEWNFDTSNSTSSGSEEEKRTNSPSKETISTTSDARQGSGAIDQMTAQENIRMCSAFPPISASLGCVSNLGNDSLFTLDTDFESVASSSKAVTEPFPDKDPVQRIIDLAVSQLVSGDTDSISLQPRTCSSGESGSKSTSLPSKFPKNDRKRQRQDEDESDPDDCNPHGLKHLKSKAGISKQFACPFWKLSPSKSKCHRHSFDKIARVKQHLQIKHKNLLCCQRCLATFKVETEFDQHVGREPACDAVAFGTESEIIPPHKQSMLRKRSNKRLCSEEQWFVIWDILFPRVQRPTSPYVDARLADQISGFCEHFDKYASEVVEEILKSEVCKHDLERGRIEQVIRNCLSKGLDRICQQGPRNPPGGALLEKAIAETPDQSTTDSGLGMENQTMESRPLQPWMGLRPTDNVQSAEYEPNAELIFDVSFSVPSGFSEGIPGSSMNSYQDAHTGFHFGIESDELPRSNLDFDTELQELDRWWSENIHGTMEGKDI